MTKAPKTILLIALHIIVWLLFLSLPTLFNPRRQGQGIDAFVNDLLLPPRTVNGLLLVAVFYFNYYIAIPLLYVRQRYAALLMSFAGCFGAFFLLNSVIIPHQFHPVSTLPLHGEFSRVDSFNLFGPSFNLFMFIIIYMMSFAARVYQLWQEAKEQMLNAQITFLKGQINPHFLFNTLNSIYSLALSGSEQAPGAVLKLSGMMRYSVAEAGEELVSLRKELDYIANYTDLQKLRLAQQVKIRYEVIGEPLDKQIAPFLLIPFVENAFKYGANPDEDSDIHILILINGNSLELQVTNNKVYIRPESDNSAGLGIKTTRKRLALLYPGRHSLTITDNAVNFNVSLQIHSL